MPVNLEINKSQVLANGEKAVKIIVDASGPTDSSTTSTESLSSESKDGVFVSHVTAVGRIKLDASFISAAAKQAALAASKQYANKEEERIKRNSLGSMPPPPPLFSHRSFPSPSGGSTQTSSASRSLSGSQAGASGSSLIPPTWSIKSLTPEAIAAAANEAVRKMMGSHSQLKEPKPSTSTGSVPRPSNSGILLGPRDVKELDPNKPDEGWMAANVCYAKFANDKIPLTLSSEIIADLDQDLAALQLDAALSQISPLPALVSASPKKRLRDTEVS